MTRRGWWLFGVVALLWGLSYLFIRVAVQAGIAPVVVVWGRTGLAALALLPVALHRGALHGLAGRWRGIAVLTLAQVTAPFLLIAYGEQHISSSLAGLLVATEPILVVLIGAALSAVRLGHSASERIDGRQVIGLVVGFGGVTALLGVDVGGVGPQLIGASLVILAAWSYAVAALLIRRVTVDRDPLGVITGILTLNAVVLTPVALLALPTQMPELPAAASMTALGVLCTAAAFLAYFALIAEAGPARGTVVFFVTPIVTVAAGALVLGEEITVATLLGLLLIVIGSRLATRSTGGARRSARAGDGGSKVSTRRVKS